MKETNFQSVTKRTNHRSTRAQVFTLYLKVVFSLVLVLLSAAPVAAKDANHLKIKNATVKIFTVVNPADYANPWNMLGTGSLAGSGCVIRGKKIITNAHVISDHTFIQVRRFGESKKYSARLIAVSHEADLALLTVDDPAFFKGITPLELGGLPQVQQDVVVYGYPYGGDTLSTTKGVISRVEHQVYTHSMISLLAAQIDAAINPGSSGGPVIIGDKVVGVVMEMVGSMQNIGYMVPVPVINHFLNDLKDGKCDGFPEDGIVCQAMENEAMRRMYHMKKGQTGVLTFRVAPGSPGYGRIFKGDVVLKIDGHEVANDATVEFRPQERTNMNYYTEMHQIGESETLTVLRRGKVMDVAIPLTDRVGTNQLVPLEQYDRRPTYYLFGGLIFAPLTVNYLQNWGDGWMDAAPANLVNTYLYEPLKKEGEEAVILMRVLPHEVNRGYHGSGNFRVMTVNGKKVMSLKELISIIENSKDEFLVIGDRWGTVIVLDREKARKATAKIMRVYQVPQDRSSDLRPGAESAALSPGSRTN